MFVKESNQKSFIRDLSPYSARNKYDPHSECPDMGNIPTELLDKIRIDFFAVPMQAAYKAIAEAWYQWFGNCGEAPYKTHVKSWHEKKQIKI